MSKEEQESQLVFHPNKRMWPPFKSIDDQKMNIKLKLLQANGKIETTVSAAIKL